ncbi:uncharacterized protein [Procambarus clarkii]|uniref:uncharacterized protein n=1 Tax=Procambarus clarkii TaxID=6728 RepID=UPI003742C7ED
MRVLLLVFPVGLVLLLVTQWTCGDLWPLRTFIVRNMTFPSNTPFIETLTTTSVCRCKMRCLTSVKCEAFTAVPVAGQTFQCSLSTEGPGTKTPVPSLQGAVYGYKLAKLESSFVVTEEADGLVYFSPSDITVNDIPPARSYCKKFPGFRLGIMKTESQLNIGNKLSTSIGHSFRIDLQKIGSTLNWGDGTLFNLSLSRYIKYLGGSNDDTFRIMKDGIYVVQQDDINKWVLCQGNDKDEAW